jgi:O-methyltransferase involved in polyketide biosynthesis
MAADEWMKGAPDSVLSVKIDTTVAHQARIYDYLLGGKDNFEVDREAADQAIEAFPGLVSLARNNRAFLGRVVRYLVAEAGVTQFLDIGTGLPTKENTHEVAQQIEPTSRVCYVDNDPIVLTHARALLVGHQAGATNYVHADLRDPAHILGAAAETLDFSRPVAVMLLAILHMLPDPENPYRVVSQLMDAVPPGSFLVITHPASDIQTASMAEMARRFNERLGRARGRVRDREEVARFFSGLDLVPPGVVTTPRWRPDPSAEQAKTDPAYAAVARKPGG